MKSKILSHVRNIPGWRTNRKIVVFESDDWGAIRMPSKNTYLELLNKGLKVDQSAYNNNDSLESNDDLNALFTVLLKYKDKYGNNPVFTTLTITANPDFDKIKKNGFETYEYESVLETLKRYGSTHNKVSQLWMEGIDSGVFHPEFHGREHLNVKRWMNAIKKENSTSRISFDYNFYGLGPEESNEQRKNHFPAFDLDDLNDLKDQKIIIKEGLLLFSQIFKYKAEFFVPPNFYYSTQLEKFLVENGIYYLPGSRRHKEPLGNEQFKTSIRYTGKKNKIGQTYLVRNVQFEYSQTKNNNEWNRALKDIETAFFWKKPVIISTHRLNYIGHINEKNRKDGLYQLDKLLKNIIKKWPEVEFMTSTQLGQLINQS